MSITNVGLIGATGNLGPAIHKALLDAGFHVTILSREGSNSTDSLPSHPNQKVVKVNFEDINSIASGLKGIQVLVSNIASHALMSQKTIIDGAVKAGVQRYIPSDFGSDQSIEANAKVPFNAPKLEVQNYAREQAKEHPNFSWTSVYNGPFFDWCLQMGLLGDLKKHTATLWDGGNTAVSWTTLSNVGKAVVGVIKNFDATKNKEVRVSDVTMSQNEMISIAKSIDGKEWTTEQGDTAAAYKAGLDEFQKPEPNMMVAVLNQLYRIIFSPEHEPDMSNNLDNKMLGVTMLTEEQKKDIIKSCMA